MGSVVPRRTPRQRGFALVDVCIASLLVVAVVLPLVAEFVRQRDRQLARTRRAVLSEATSRWSAGLWLTTSDMGDRIARWRGEEGWIVRGAGVSPWRRTSWEGSWEWQAEWVVGEVVDRIVMSIRSGQHVVTRVVVVAASTGG